MSRRLVPVAVLVLVVLSGCSGALDPGPSAQDVEPADADLPPGVNESGVTNATALAQAHNESLRTEGFVMNGTYARELQYGENKTTSHHHVVAPGANRYRVVQRTVVYAPPDADSTVTQRSSAAYWVGPDATVRRSTVDSSTASGPVKRPGSLPDVTKATYLGQVLQYGNLSVERVVERDGHTYTTLVANDTNVSAEYTTDTRFVVDERGIIHEAVIDTTGESPTAHAEYRVVTLGADPERPDWVANATNE